MKNKNVFEDYIKKNFSARFQSIMETFEIYHSLLLEANDGINLVSRKTIEDDFWNLHYLDSILPSEVFDFDNKNVLDFGTGGGLPGIPLKIIFPKMKITFLDSRSKKINVVTEITKKMKFDGCYFSKKRLEDFNVDNLSEKFDFIVSRSVKMNNSTKKNI